MTTSMYCLYVGVDYTYIDINALAQGIKSYVVYVCVSVRAYVYMCMCLCVYVRYITYCNDFFINIVKVLFTDKIQTFPTTYVLFTN